ncbi:tRNA adenosine(34) deaminase TadA [Thermosediminibacter litoriperuensis]|uniref:tRNA-specific adenosine deaminase n=1 Tax=Thermosediminibacter litoriperuensis TaxID=291989 RepID=A0A5S5ANU3_9FIRM|nr:tRNA adenosine(34) deaminase TadA [Thermosediminibacter litoriperuensis]TYP52515.1 tRNA(adenine34) deaminase [Thermosediminibacter litoriperuensis]
MQEKDHEYFMREALKEARKAFEEDEVPIGAVIAYDGRIIARAHNLREGSRDATAHAEVLAIRAACDAMGTWRLTGCSLYVTLEPCPMCAGAIILARLDRVVFGAQDPKAGAAGSVVDLFSVERFNHHPEVVSGVLAEECGILLKEFFRQKRS